jgi:hypothetical protein
MQPGLVAGFACCSPMQPGYESFAKAKPAFAVLQP